MPQIQTYPRQWRSHLATLVKSASAELLIAAPYIKTREANWICNRLSTSVHLRVLTDLNSQSVLAGALDMEALTTFTDSHVQSEILTLPRLHAKVYVADDSMAIVTSGNLTQSSLDEDYEYGLGLKDRPTIQKIRQNLESYARLGSTVARETLQELATIATDLIQEAQRLREASPKAIRKQFDSKVRTAHQRFLEVQVGSRSANSVFGEAILMILASGPRTTVELAPEVKRLLPDLSDDNEELIINGARYGKAWKHCLRNAQQSLKGRDLITYHQASRRWVLTG